MNITQIGFSVNLSQNLILKIEKELFINGPEKVFVIFLKTIVLLKNSNAYNPTGGETFDQTK